MKDFKSTHLEREKIMIESSPYIFLAEDDIDDQELLIEAMIHHADNIRLKQPLTVERLCFF